MKLRILLTGLAVLVATVLPTAASAHPDHGRGKFRSLPPDLTTKYLQGHKPHKDPLHPDARYRHLPLSTADERGVERFDGTPETIPAGQLCDFPVVERTWGTRPFYRWLEEGPDGEPRLTHVVENPKLVSKYSANGRSFWTIDEGWDYVWFNYDDSTIFIEGTATHFWVHDKERKFRMYGTWHLVIDDTTGELAYVKLFRDKTSVWDGSIEEIDPKICEFLTPRS
jgi:hypothetical protein